jgi:hypothetical protein
MPRTLKVVAVIVLSMPWCSVLLPASSSSPVCENVIGNA